MTQAPSNPYDEIPYPGEAYAQSHPDRLETLAALFGLKAPEIQSCRVLELACADGSNLIPMACALPGSTFLGIDLSRREIDAGREAVAVLGLANIELRHVDIRDVDESFGTFDYVIAHGIYSWVSAEVQEMILQICHERLEPNGVAYVSYNTNPGWRMRGMLRDMMLYHSRKFDDPQQQIAQARALIDWLDETVRAADSPYAVLLRSELEQMHGWRDSYFRHDSLEEVNAPAYFHEFMERAERHGLQYLAEAEFHTMLASNYAPPVSETLNRLGRDIIELEQYMDFVRNRMFRQTLLCHRGVKLKRALGPWTLHDLRVAAGFRPKTGNLDIASHEAGEFSDSGRATISSNQPIVKAAFLLLGQHWPKSIPFRELVGLARSHLEAAGPNSPAIPAGRAAEEAVAGAILTCLSKGACELHVHAGAFVTTISERPLACPYSRWQARSGPVVTNRRHERVELDNFGRQLLLLLDGEKDRDALVDSLTQLAVAGTLIVLVDEKVTHDREIIRAIMPAQAEAKLLQLGRLALLVG